MDDGCARLVTAAIAELATCLAAPGDAANVLVAADREREARDRNQTQLLGGAAKGDGPPIEATALPLMGTRHDQLLRTDRGWCCSEHRGSLYVRSPKRGQS